MVSFCFRAISAYNSLDMDAPIGRDMAKAVEIIQEGRVVGVPTGTSYGLAADALQGNALQRVRNLKKRPAEKTFTVFLQKKLWRGYFTLSDEEEALLARYEGEALTLLLKPKEALEHLAQEGRVGLRMIDHSLMQKLAEAVEVPLTATSANVSDMPPCYDPPCLQQTFPWVLDASDPALRRAGATTYDLSLGYILDGGKLTSGTMSTIVRLKKGKPHIVRAGSLKVETGN